MYEAMGNVDQARRHFALYRKLESNPAGQLEADLQGCPKTKFSLYHTEISHWRHAVLRNIGAVLAGYISIGVLVVATDTLLMSLNPGSHVEGQTPPVFYFVVSLFTAPLYSVVGGYITAWLGKAQARTCVIGLAIFGELMGIVSTVMFWGKQPLWYAIALLVLFPPAVLLGGWLRTHKRERMVAA